MKKEVLSCTSMLKHTTTQNASVSTLQNTDYCRDSTIDIISPYCLVLRATDEVASLQLQTAHCRTVSMEGSDQLSSGFIPHLGQCRADSAVHAVLHDCTMHYKSHMPYTRVM